jgi:predicted  nucleic acid-binding Zn-ribbon protein
MQNPTEEELEESIKELTEYKNRLEKEVVTISNKLKMPQKKINAIIKSHSELNQIKVILSKLTKQKENVTSSLIP